MTRLVEFPERLEWLNVGERPRLSALRGRAVALLFVNLGSQWSLAVARRLAQVQARQRGRLQALAVHVPRFEFERDAARMLKLAHRERFPLPLAHDRDWVLWQHHGITAWPSLLLADATGAGPVLSLRTDGSRPISGYAARRLRDARRRPSAATASSRT